MTTAILQRELKKIAQKHQQIGDDIRHALMLVSEERDLPYGDWELKPSAVKRIEKARRDIAAGKGVAFRNADDMQKYLRAMRHGR
jgi:hypothetical protein